MSGERRQDSQMPPAVSPRRSTKSNFLIPACLLNERCSVDGAVPDTDLQLLGDDGEGPEKRQLGDSNCSFMSSQIKQVRTEEKKLSPTASATRSPRLAFRRTPRPRRSRTRYGDMFLGGSGQQRPCGEAALDNFGHFLLSSLPFRTFPYPC
jgi:hypothetical protein